MRTLFLFVILLFATPIYGYHTKFDKAYKSLRDPKNPTVLDFRKLERSMDEDIREKLPFKNTGRFIPIRRGFRFLDSQMKRSPPLKVIHCGTKGNRNKRAIICYVSMNKPYPALCQRLTKSLIRLDIDADLLMQIGGYPNINAGDLSLCDVPYAFKICMFRQAQDLGYKSVLWLDASLYALKDPSPLFSVIEKHGYFAFTAPNCTMQTQLDSGHLDVKLYNSLPFLKDKHPQEIYHVWATIVGLNLKSATGRGLLHEWYEMAKNKDSFVSNNPEEVPLSAILSNRGLPILGFRDDYFSEETHNPTWKMEKMFIRDKYMSCKEIPQT